MLQQQYRQKRKRRSRRIIYVSIRSIRTSQSNKINTSTDLHYSYSTDNRSDRRFINKSNSIHTFSQSNRTVEASKSRVTIPCQINDTWANTTDYTKKGNRNENKKKKWMNCRNVTIILTILLLLIAAIIAVLVILLTKHSTQRNRSLVAVLRWNQTGITIAGVTEQSGNTSDRLNNPRGLFMDWSYTLYITDGGNNRIQKYLRNAAFGETVAGQASGISGVGAEFLTQPYDVQVDLNGDIYIADTMNHRIQRWYSGSTNGTTIAGTTGVIGTSASLFNRPYGIQRDSMTNGIYIADGYNQRIMYYTVGAINGTIVAGGNGAGINNNQLDNPLRLYYDAISNSLVIPNFIANNVVRWVLGASNWTLIAGYLNGTNTTSSSGFWCPRDVTLDPMGNVYVVDRNNHRVQFFSAGQSDGTTIAGITSVFGSNNSLLNTPLQMTLDNQLNLYVSDNLNHRVQKFLRY